MPKQIPPKKLRKKIIQNGNQHYFYTWIAGSFTIAVLAVTYQLMQSNNEVSLSLFSSLDTKSNIPNTMQQILPALAVEKEQSDLEKLELPAKTINATALSLCEAKLQEIKKKSYFPERLTQPYPIKVDPRVNAEEIKIETAISNCKQAFNEILQEPSYFPNLLPDLKLIIVLIPERYLHSNGFYAPTERVIQIVYRPNETIEGYKKTLKNEFFSHQVEARNILNNLHTTSKSEIVFPFLRKNGDINEKEYEKFEASITEAKQIIRKYKKLLAKKTIGEKNKSEIDALLDLVEKYKYTPKNYFLSEEQFNQAIEYGLITAPDNNGNFTTGPNSQSHLPLIYGNKKGESIIYTYCEDETARSKAIALINDIQEQLDAVENPTGRYASRSAAQKLTDKASFIAELPDEMQKILFPDFYMYMCEFFTTDKNLTHQKKSSTNPPAKEKRDNTVQQTKKIPHFFQPKQEPNKQQPSKQAHTTTHRPPSQKHHHFRAR